MKQQLFLKWSLGIALSVLPLVGGCLRGGSGAPPPVVSVSESPTDPALAYRPVGEDEEIAGSSQEGEISEAPVKMIDAEKPVPANIQPSGPLAEIIRFADSGVEEKVMLAYVTSAGSAFDLGPDWVTAFPRLSEELPLALWQQAWQAWCRPRNLPPAEVEACRLERQECRLRPTA